MNGRPRGPVAACPRLRCSVATSRASALLAGPLAAPPLGRSLLTLSLAAGGAILTLFLCTLGWAEELPSLFRGVTVGEGRPGVVVMFVREDAFAVAAGMRVGDHIVAIDEQPINSLDEFAAMSRALTGKRTDATVTLLRGGTRFTTDLSLTSPTVRSAWGLTFLPDYSLRFVDPNAARRYWSQRAAQELLQHKDIEAMRSLLNVLHYAPDAYDEALALCEAVLRQGERLWAEGKRTEAVGVMQQAVALYRQAAAKPLTAQQWRRVKRALQGLLETLKTTPAAPRES